MKALASLTAAAFASLAMAAAVPAAAQPGPFGGVPHGGAPHGGARLADAPTTRIVEMMTRRLELTPEQQVQMRDILDSTRASLKERAAESRTILEQTRTKIDAVLTPEQQGKAREIRQALFAGAAGFAKSRGPHAGDGPERAGEEMKVRAALAEMNLTEEQRGKLREIEKDMQARRQEILEAVRPRMEALREEAKKSLTAVLTPEQQQELKRKMEAMPAGPAMGARRDRGAPRAQGAEDERGPQDRADRADRRMRGLRPGGPGAGEGPSDRRPGGRGEGAGARPERSGDRDVPPGPPPHARDSAPESGMPPHPPRPDGGPEDRPDAAQPSADSLDQELQELFR